MTARVVAICNQKGGVGKTALTTALADVVAEAGRRVLVVDADPQANATQILGVNVDADQLTLADVLSPAPADASRVLAGTVRKAGIPWPAIDVVPAERGLAAQESDSALGREARLREALTPAVSGYDVVLIDCPPSLGMLTVNALVAADAALVVSEPRASSVNAVAEMLQTIASVRVHYNPRLSLAGIVVNRWSAQRVDRRAHWDVLVAQYGQWLLDPAIPDREIVAVAATNRVPVPREGAGAEVMTAIAALADAGGLR